MGAWTQTECVEEADPDARRFDESNLRPDTESSPRFGLEAAILTRVNLYGLNIAGIQDNERSNHYKPPLNCCFEQCYRFGY
jgi:hypothetical protein